LWAVVGLGNPGQKYARTRHNAGSLLVSRLANKWNVKLKVIDKTFRGAEVKRDDHEILLAKPRVFMNMSGAAVKRIRERYNIPLENLIIVHDDFDILLGEIRIKRAGSSGSHKGIMSVIERLETQDFARIKIGIGPVPEGIDPSDFVLSSFKERERAWLQESIDNAIKAFDIILNSSLDRAMNVYNKKRSHV
jgi:PTH1 family peptidyl-tRNA hydrolase